MDLLDFDNTYQIHIPRITLTSPLVFHCICAFTAKHLCLSNARLHGAWDPIARQHYGEALRLLIKSLNDPFCEYTLTATLLVSSYEILARIGATEHKRHFLGTTMLIRSQGVTAQSCGIDRANFWIYARHEIGVALSTEEPLILNPDVEWNVSLNERETREDVLGNHVLWILARVINLVFGPEGSTDASRPKREAFLDELEEWRLRLPDAFIGISYGDKVSQNDGTNGRVGPRLMYCDNRTKMD
jgi:hypothetical protein